MQQEMQANVSRFAAYKAHQATQEILEHIDSDDYENKAKQIINKYNRYQVAEHNTAVARSRTAKQWGEFNEDDLKNKMYPNLKWLPSSSADPREEHRVFYGLVLPKNDPFWNSNYPGNLWNCKCDWEETDEPAFNGEVAYVKPHNGLGGNPAKDKIIFTDDASYFRNAPRETEKKCGIIARALISKSAKNNPLLNQKTTCKINGVEKIVGFTDFGIREYSRSMFSNRDYWLKNEILNQMPNYIKNAKCVKSNAKVDLTHNAGVTLRRKRQLAYFHYLEILLPNSNKAYLHIAELKTGECYLYTITSSLRQ